MEAAQIWPVIAQQVRDSAVNGSEKPPYIMQMP